MSSYATLGAANKPRNLIQTNEFVTFVDGGSSLVLPKEDALNARGTLPLPRASQDNSNDAPSPPVFTVEQPGHRGLLMLCPVIYDASPAGKQATISIHLTHDLGNVAGFAPSYNNPNQQHLLRTYLAQIRFTAGGASFALGTDAKERLVTGSNTTGFSAHLCSIAEPLSGSLLPTGIVRLGSGWFGIDIGDANAEITVACTAGEVSTAQTCSGVAFLTNWLSVVGS
jgi:hypothetical protein